MIGSKKIDFFSFICRNQLSGGVGEEKQDNLYHIHPTSVANLGCEYTCILYMALAATAAAAKASFQPQFRKEAHRATCFCSCFFSGL